MTRPDPCPRCGSRDTVHFEFGLPAEPIEPGHPWERHMGCLADDEDRECQDCGHRWQSGDMTLAK